MITSLFSLKKVLPHLLVVALVVSSLFVAVQYGKSMEKAEAIEGEIETIERINDSLKDSRDINHDDALDWLYRRQRNR